MKTNTEEPVANGKPNTDTIPQNGQALLNIRPFIETGILRKTPKLHWRKDRGKDVPSAPWYPVFKGDRINDHHYFAEGEAGGERMRSILPPNFLGDCP